jgi:hypothetical protein
LVFIVDPWIWLVVGGAVFLLTARTRWRALPWAVLAVGLSLLVMSQRLESMRIGYPNVFRGIWFAALGVLVLAHWKGAAARWGSRIALAALCFVVLYWGSLSFFHRSALTGAQELANRLATARNERVLRVAAMPLLANPLRWRCLAETDRATYLYDVRLGGEERASAEAGALRYAKPEGESAELAAHAAQDERAAVLLNFARFPVVRVEGDCLSNAIVQFADLRYTEPKRGQTGGGFAAVDIPVECEQGSGTVSLNE